MDLVLEGGRGGGLRESGRFSRGGDMTDTGDCQVTATVFTLVFNPQGWVLTVVDSNQDHGTVGSFFLAFIRSCPLLLCLVVYMFV